MRLLLLEESECTGFLHASRETMHVMNIVKEMKVSAPKMECNVFQDSRILETPSNHEPQSQNHILEKRCNSYARVKKPFEQLCGFLNAKAIVR